MKKATFAGFVVLVFLVVSLPAHAMDGFPDSRGSFAFKVDYFNLADSYFTDESSDGGYYVGVEIYGRIKQGFMAGYEIGWARQEHKFDDDNKIESNFIPIEFNAKYVFELGDVLLWDVGAGISANYAHQAIRVPSVDKVEKDDWLFGGQVFSDLNVVFNQVLLGIDLKYQVTDKFRSTNYRYDNYRIGLHLGFMF